MADGTLQFGHGVVKLDGIELPGIFVNQSIAGSVRFDTATPTGMSGAAKTPLGWDDADITIVVELISDEQLPPYAAGRSCYDKLAQIDAVFRGYDNGKNPKVYDVDNAHVLARGVSQVVFAGLQSKETEDDDVIQVTLNFVEHMPAVRIAEKRVAATDNAVTAAPAAVPSGDVKPDESIMVDVS